MKPYKTTEAKRARATAAYWKNPEAARARQRARHQADPSIAREYRQRDEVKQRKNAKRRAWALAHPEHTRAMNEAHHLKRYHGLTIEQYRAMVAAQDGKCAICRRPPNGRAHCQKLHVDHDHTTGKVRDLLCAHCNRAIGLFEEDPRRMTSAAWYVERHRAATCRTA